MKTSKKLISFLMCMLMVLTMVPMSVFATVGPIEIDTINIEGVLAPQYGQTVEDHFDDMIKKGDDGEFKVNGLGYYVCDLFDDMGFSLLDKDKKRLDKSEVIVEGIYYFAMDFLPSDGYVIPNDVAVTLDGALSVEKDFDEDGWLTVWAKFEVKATEIDTIHVEGVPAPLYGQTIESYYEAIEDKITDGTITVNDEVYDSTAYKYGNLVDDGWNVRTEADGPLSSTSTDLIKEGTYYVAMWFYPDIGYVIPEEVNVLFDGAKSVKIELEDDGCLDIHAEYEVKCPHTYDNACDAECNLCSEIRTAPHAYDNACDAECNNCPATRTPAAHKGGTATCTEKAKCSVCGKAYGSLKAHTYKTVTTKATLSKNGKTEIKCTVCGKVKSTQAIAKISSVTLSATKYIHDGNNKTPTVTVKDANGKKLVKNTDYKLSVASKRSGIGKYTVKVTFIGNYEGSKNVYFTILPGKPASVKSAAQTTSSVKLTWSKVSGAAGYTVYRYSPSKKAYVKAGTTEGTSLTVKGLLAGTKYTFKVVAYGKTSGGKVYNSEGYTLLKTATTTKTPAISKITTTKGKAVLTHTNVSGETGYTVYYSTKKDSGFKKYNNFKADTTTCNITKLTSGKTYYFKVRTYIKTDSGYVYSPWSAVKGIKVK